MCGNSLYSVKAISSFYGACIVPEVNQELARFLGLIPLAYMDFRAAVHPFVTAGAMPPKREEESRLLLN